jgi:cytochrome P450
MDTVHAAEQTHFFPDVDFGLDDLPDFHERMDQLREQGQRVVPVRYYNGSAWLILRYDDVRDAYQDSGHFPCSEAYKRHSVPAMGDKILLALDGQEHRTKRMLIAREFLPQKIPPLVRKLIGPLADELIDAFGDRRQLDLVENFTRPLPMYLTTRLLGLPDGDGEQLIEWVEGLFSGNTDMQRTLRARQEVTNFLLPFIHERRSRPRDDMLSMLATCEVDGERLSDEDILCFARLLFPAGSDTSYLALGSLMNAVLSDPELRQHLIDEPELQPKAVEESLRLYGTVALQARYTVSGCDLHGVRIPPNSWVLFGNAPANRDPDVFSDPHRFDLARDHKKMITFGAGPHVCIGAHLARGTLATGLARLLGRLPGFRLAGPAQTPTGGVLRGVRRLEVAFDDVLPAICGH